MKRDFLGLADLSSEQIQGLLDLAVALKKELRAGGNAPRLAGLTLGMVFQKPSLRTRVSFDVGMSQLGGRAVYISPNEVGLGTRESVPDVARVLSRFVDGIMARVFDHDDVVGLAQWASVPVINGLSAYNHPCQGLTDLLTVQEKLGRLSGVRLAYLGDGNNMLTSLMLGGARMGMHIVSATPANYAPDAQAMAQAQQFAAESGGSVAWTSDAREAVRDADVLYTDTWTSMGQEEESAARRQVFPPYQINAELLALARPEAGVLHCLPAHRGEEITDEVADGPRSWIFDQAENRLHAQKAILVDLLER